MQSNLTIDGVHSYEQRSSLEIGSDAASPLSRLIVVDRSRPEAFWSTPNQPIAPRSAWLASLRSGLSSVLADVLRPTASLNRAISAQVNNNSLTVSSTKLSSINECGPFPSNEWLTSRYTWLTLIPKNLFEQFTRFANFYFLVTATLQIVLPFSPVGPATSLLPLLFVVATSAIKQAYEDYLRHQLDKEVNNRTCRVLKDKRLVQVRSKDIRVGDLVYVRNNEEIPCDMLLLATSNNGDRCYVTTANLDGETNLKIRSCFQVRQEIGNLESIDKGLLVIECDKPNATLYEFSGCLRVPKDEESYKLLLSDLLELQAGQECSSKNSYGYVSQQHFATATSLILSRLKEASVTNKHNYDDKQENQKCKFEFHEIAMDINNLLLRASRLRNTGYIYGVAIYTGRDTKLAHNSQVKSYKVSSIEGSVNLFLIIAVLLLLTFSFAGAVMHTKQQVNDTEPPASTTSRAPYSFTEVLIAHYLLYNYLVPISLYVTLEFIKFFGVLSVVEDRKMRELVLTSSSDGTVAKTIDSANRKKQTKKVVKVQKPKCNSSDLNEELGQIEVLFSDKTGTLTENKMCFTACSIYGRLHRSIADHLYFQPADLFGSSIPKVARKLATISLNRHAHLGAHSGAENELHNVLSRPKDGTSAHSDTSGDQPFDHRVHPPLNKLKTIGDLRKHQDVVDFFICLCLCSTITLNESLDLDQCLPDNTSNEYSYHSASPDEESLISAAHAYGITLCKSSDQDCFIVIKSPERAKPPQRLSKSKSSTRRKYRPLPEKLSTLRRGYIVRHFKRLLVLEFNSTRKRMSVIYRDCDNDCYLMVSKGSEELLDCIKMNNLDAKGENQIDATLAHFEAFAKSGLRTLLVARKVLTNQEFSTIQKELNEARQSMQHRDYFMNKVHKKAETDLKLVGGTAVEDTLQFGVPETIANLKDAGIKVWLLTGDKVETAISVAYLCRLLEREMILFYLVRQQDAPSCQKLLTTFTDQLSAYHGRDSTKHKTGENPNSHKSNSRIRHQSEAHLFALIVDGRSLYYAMNYARDELVQVSEQCTCVLGCRLSPLQKAEVVSMIKLSARKPITAAIGDGANDVSMIQEAHVGIGVAGKEGRQAVNCSDFAIGKFHMLNRLIFVHGQLFYHRTANTIHYFFYKNLLFILPQFLFAFYNNSSGKSLYHPIFLMTFNLMFTSVPILLYGLYEIHISESILESHPELYKLNTHNKLLQLRVFFSWQFSAAIQALSAFFFLKFLFADQDPPLESNDTSRVNGFAVILFLAIVLAVTSKLLLVAKYHNLYLILCSILSCLSLPLLLFVYSLFRWSFLTGDNSLYGAVTVYFESPNFWLSVSLTFLIALVPSLLSHFCGRIKFLKRFNTILKQNETT